MVENPIFTLYHYGSVIWNVLLHLADVFMMPMNSPEFYAAIGIQGFLNQVLPIGAPVYTILDKILLGLITLAGDMSLFEFVMLSLPVLLVLSFITNIIFKIL